MTEWSEGFVFGVSAGLSVYLGTRLVISMLRDYAKRQRAAANGDGPWVH